MIRSALAAAILVIFSLNGASAFGPLPPQVLWLFQNHMQRQRVEAEAAAASWRNFYYQQQQQQFAAQQRAIAESNRAFQDYMRTVRRNSERRSQIISDYTMQAIRGCTPKYDRRGHRHYVCP